MVIRFGCTVLRGQFGYRVLTSGACEEMGSMWELSALGAEQRQSKFMLYHKILL